MTIKRYKNHFSMFVRTPQGRPYYFNTVLTRNIYYFVSTTTHICEHNIYIQAHTTIYNIYDHGKHDLCIWKAWFNA